MAAQQQQKRTTSRTTTPAPTVDRTPSSSPAPLPSKSLSPAAQQAHDRFTFLILNLVGTKVIATVKGGIKIQGILATATTEGAELSLALRQAQTITTKDGSQAPSSPVKEALIILSRDLLEISASDVDLKGEKEKEKERDREAFKTDTDISRTPIPERREKELKAWGSGEVLGNGNGGIGGLSLDEEKGSNRAWDQFAANEKLYGLKTDYHEDLYTTKLDRSGADYGAKARRAAQLEMEIMKGSGSLANNAHMAEERGAVADDSGLDEEDRYGAVIRGPDAYVPPGARKAASRLPPTTTTTTTTTPTIEEPKSRPAPTPTPTVDHQFRQFVSSEKERLTQKKNTLLKEAQKKEHDTKLASLLQFSKEFKLPNPIPSDMASILGHDPVKKPSLSPSPSTESGTGAGAGKKLESSSTAVTPSHSPIRAPRTLSPRNTLVPEIPPFKAKNSGNGSSPAVSPKPAPAATPTASTSKINPNATPFVFKPNPNASAFTPSFASASASPARKPAELPGNPFFGNKPIKKGNSSMHVKEDFTPFKNGHIADPSSSSSSWSFSGKSYRASLPMNPSPSNDDDHGMTPQPQGPPHGQGPQGPPGQYVYQQYQPGFPPRFPAPPQQQPVQHMMPPPGAMHFQNFPPPPPPMGFQPPPGPHGAPMYTPSPQMQSQVPPQAYMRFGQFPPQQQNGVPLGFVDPGRSMAGP